VVVVVAITIVVVMVVVVMAVVAIIVVPVLAVLLPTARQWHLPLAGSPSVQLAYTARHTPQASSVAQTPHPDPLAVDRPHPSSLRVPHVTSGLHSSTWRQ
jgi:hypothetical protein